MEATRKPMTNPSRKPVISCRIILIESPLRIGREGLKKIMFEGVLNRLRVKV